MMGKDRECRWYRSEDINMWAHIRDYVGTDQGMHIMGTDRGWR